METAKQNQKFPFHFLSAPPTPPAEENKKGKENFWFLLRQPKGADEARRLVVARIVLVKSSDFVQETQPSFRIRFFAKMRSVAKRRDGGFRENSPRVFEIQKKRAGREAGVYDEYIIQNFVLRANQEANNYQYLT
ncbi:TPA: hypothetical protein DD445_00615 [Candidatus Nomurabacteria bacterium]|nr:hypothetical protein [Candidatus Nomurabacteria bacterium]HBP27287.1 hypothetical protein [Candidatus Nomurabacteria bacterium]